MFHLYFPLKYRGWLYIPTHSQPIWLATEVKKTLPRFQTRHVYKCLGVTDGSATGDDGHPKEKTKKKEQKGVPKKRYVYV